MKKIKRLLIMSLIILMMLPFTTQKVQATAGTQSNAGTGTGATAGNLSNFDASWISKRGILKVSIYLGTTDDPADMPKGEDGKYDLTKANINKFEKFGETIFISNVAHPDRTGRANIEIAKLEALKAAQNESYPQPSYNFNGSPYYADTTTVAVNGKYPEWYSKSKQIATAENVKKYFESDSANTWLVIKEIANRYGTGGTPQEKIQSLLNKISFDFSSVSKITDEHINPTSSKDKFIVPILVVAEPCLYLKQAAYDPVKNPNGTRIDFIMTPTDMALSAPMGNAKDPNALIHHNFIQSSSGECMLRWKCETCGGEAVTALGGSITKCWKPSCKGVPYSYQWWLFNVGPAGRDLCNNMKPDKTWFNGLMSPLESNVVGGDPLSKWVKYGGYHAFFIGETSEQEDVEVTPIMEVRVIDSAMEPIVGIKTIAGMEENQDTTKLDENYEEVKEKLSEELKEKIEAEWIPEAKTTIDAEFKGIQIPTEIISKEDFEPVTFKDEKLGGVEIENRTHELVNEMLGHADIISPNTQEEDYVYIYTDEMVSIYEQILDAVETNVDTTALGNQYQSIANTLVSKYENHMENNPEQDPDAQIIQLSDGTNLYLDPDINNVMNKIGWEDTFILLGENPKLTDEHNPDVILSIENPPKVNIVIPAIKTLKIVSEEDAPDDPVAPPPSVDSIKEDELTKGLSFDFSRPGKVVEDKSIFPDTTCGGTKEEPYQDWQWCYNRYCNKYHPQNPWQPWEHLENLTRTVSCNHPATLTYKKSFTISKAYIETKNFWDYKMFDGVPVLSVLRTNNTLTNNGVNFVFLDESGNPKVSQYEVTGTDIQNIYKSLKKFRYIGHRSGGSSATTVKLAAYMNESSLNKNYLNWIKDYYNVHTGSEYPSLYKNQDGTFGSHEYDVKTNLQTTTVKIDGRLTSCGFNSANLTNLMKGKIDHSPNTSFITESTVIVDKTVNATDFKNSKYTDVNDNVDFQTVYSGSVLGKGTSEGCAYHIKMESEPYTFNPAFKINYWKDNKNIQKDQVWILAYGDRTFKGTDYIKIEFKVPNLDVTSQWSRDLEDRDRTEPTTKSGSTIRATADGSAVTISVWYHVQDPAFVGKVGSAEYNAAQTKLNETVKAYDDAVQEVIDKLKEANNVAFYSNMYQACPETTMHRLESPSNFQDLTEKTEFKQSDYTVVTPQPTYHVYYVDANNSKDFKSSTRTINLNGTSKTFEGQWRDSSDPDGVIDSEKRLKELLINDKTGYTKQWYTEDYEGIVIVNKIWRVEFNDLYTKYAQIHPQHSDNLTTVDKLAKDLPFAMDNSIAIIKGTDGYGIGLECKIPEFTIKENTIPEGALVSKPYMYHIRGSVYDIK